MVSSSAGIGGAWVFIKLASNDASNSDYNRIWLQAESVGITTGKTVMAAPIPFSGLVTGESTSLALDLGMASKTLNISGVLVEQEIKKKFGDWPDASTADAGTEDKGVTRKMTAQEISQLLHSYVDSSFFQDQQNMNELIVVYPSYVDKNWEYHSGLDANSELADAKMVPFNYAVRDAGTTSGLDARGSIGGSDFPSPINTDTGEINGVKGFIRNFTTTHEGSPFVTFTMDFEVAITIGF
jgi:hypothetical protein